MSEVAECWVLDMDFVQRVQTEVFWAEVVKSRGVDALRENRAEGFKMWKVKEGEEERTERISL